MRSPTFFIIATAIGAAVFLTARWIGNDYLFFAGYTVLQFIVLATAWNILGGYCGYVNFGSADFFAVGAYSTVALHKLGMAVDRYAAEAVAPLLHAIMPLSIPILTGRLAPGQTLLVPTAAVASAALNIPDPGIEKYPRSTGKVKVHAVRRGESVGGIAKKYGTTSARLMALNGLKKPLIFPGQSLIISGTPVKAVKAKATRTRASSTASASRVRSKVKAKRVRAGTAVE